ncbi:MAG: cell division protein ZapE [Alphaproteobacteria bacterium]|nr:cell division protein ZapE [Alphaproteobacteria bacterium]
MLEHDSRGPLAAYHALCTENDISFDPDQERAAQALERLCRDLARHAPKPVRGFRLFSRRKVAEPAPRGIYLYGAVGRGKTMLMDLFFDAVLIERKRRVHFHAFMQEVHKAINVVNRAIESEGDPIPSLARKIAEDTGLLCFDEFHVTDIADAMILGRLFQALFEAGVVPVTTSNWHPDELYAGGLNRQLFLPFIAMIKERLDIVSLDGPQDYRQLFLKQARLYHTPLSPAAEAELAQAFERLSGGGSLEPVALDVQGRTLKILRAAKGVAWLSFAELCEQPLGPADYLALANSFHTLVLSGIPRLGKEKRNEAKRFVTLIDILYEHKVHLVCAADAPPSELYQAGDGAFEFERTVSRLTEMQSEDYLSEHHVP